MSDLTKYIDLLKIQIKKRKGQRSGTFSTFGKEYPHARNIIIRDYLDDKIVFFTHTLSQKVEDIQTNPASSLCWYDHRHQIQLQFYGKTTIAESQMIKDYQSKVQNFKDYQGPKPGSKLGSLMDKDIHFMVLIMQVEKLIALEIGIEEYKKYEFQYEQGSMIEVVP